MERSAGNRIKRVNSVFMPKRKPQSSCVLTSFPPSPNALHLSILTIVAGACASSAKWMLLHIHFHYGNRS